MKKRMTGLDDCFGGGSVMPFSMLISSGEPCDKIARFPVREAFALEIDLDQCKVAHRAT